MSIHHTVFDRRLSRSSCDACHVHTVVYVAECSYLNMNPRSGLLIMLAYIAMVAFRPYPVSRSLWRFVRFVLTSTPV